MFRRSVGDTSKQPYFHLSACRRSSGAGIQSAIQGEWVFTRRIEDCAKPPAPGVSQAARRTECRVVRPRVAREIRRQTRPLRTGRPGEEVRDVCRRGYPLICWLGLSDSPATGGPAVDAWLDQPPPRPPQARHGLCVRLRRQPTQTAADSDGSRLRRQAAGPLRAAARPAPTARGVSLSPGAGGGWDRSARTGPRPRKPRRGGPPVAGRGPGPPVRRPRSAPGEAGPEARCGHRRRRPRRSSPWSWSSTGYAARVASLSSRPSSQASRRRRTRSRR